MKTTGSPVEQSGGNKEDEVTMKKFVITLLALSLIGCASLQHTATIDLPTGSVPATTTVDVYEYTRSGVLSSAGVTLIVQEGKVVGVVSNRPGWAEILGGQLPAIGATLGSAFIIRGGLQQMTTPSE